MRFTTVILTLLSLAVSLAGVGCQSSSSRSVVAKHTPARLNESLVLPGARLVKAWPSEAADRLNHRRNAVLGADRLPYAPAINSASEVESASIGANDDFHEKAALLQKSM